MTRVFELILAMALVVLLAASLLPGIAPLSPGFVWPWERKLDGLIVIDSPEVYTRERLVNDRFMQTTWLLKELERYEPGADYQERSDISQQRSLVGGVGLSGPEPDMDGAADEAAEDTPARAAAELGASAIDRFRDEQSYRTEVRQAVLETMLDDRHDLQGNTLYMLKFDASIIPPRRSTQRNFAVVSVDLERSVQAPAADGDAEQPGRSTGASATADAAGVPIDPVAELRDVYDNWIEHIRDMVTDEYLNRVRIFLAQKSGEAELVEMWDAMGLGELPAAPDGTATEETNVALNALEQFFRDYKRAEGFRATYKQTFRVCSDAPDQRTAAFIDWERLRGQPAPAPLLQAYFTNITRNGDSDRPTLSQRMFEQMRRRILINAAEKAAGPDAERPDSDDYAPAQAYARWLDLVREIQGSAYANDCSPETDSGQRPWCDALDSVLKLGKLGDCDQVADLSILLENKERIQLEAFFAESSRLHELATEAWELERFLLFHYLGHYYRDILDRRLKGLAEFQLVCDTDALLCRIRVNATCPMDGAKNEDGQCPVPQAFRTALSPDDAIFFTYAATPKQNASAVLSSTRDQAAVDLAASAAVPGQGDLGGSMRARQSSAVGRVAAERRVRVMGFAGTGEQDTKPRFGWMIEPPRVGVEAQPVQQSLTAIVSLPSWWQKIRMVVRTCWRGERGFPKQEVEHRTPCSDGEVLKNEFTINLPWNVKDINRKLAYDIRRVPFIESLNGAFGGSLPVYHVGQRQARLLIEGGDLWRSTMVTLGSQRASEILVLPNMRGIVATFERIERPSIPARPGRCQIEVPIRVWTSEGVTMEDAAKAFIYADERRDNSPRCGGPQSEPTQAEKTDGDKVIESEAKASPEVHVHVRTFLNRLEFEAEATPDGSSTPTKQGDGEGSVAPVPAKQAGEAETPGVVGKPADG